MFVHMVEQRTTQIDEMLALEAEWRAATEGNRTVRQSLVLKDRNDPHRFLVLAFFDDEEAARAQSDQPESGEYADKMAALLTGLPQYTQYDLIKHVEY